MWRGFPLGHVSEARACGRWGVSVMLPDDQGFHEEIQLVLLGTHLRQRLGTEGRRPLAEGGLSAKTVANRDRWPSSGPRGTPLTFTATCRGLGSLGVPDT